MLTEETMLDYANTALLDEEFDTVDEPYFLITEHKPLIDDCESFDEAVLS